MKHDIFIINSISRNVGGNTMAKAMKRISVITLLLAICFLFYTGLQITEFGFLLQLHLEQ